jgi:hypothetical protein
MQSSSAFDGGDEMHLTGWPHGFEQAHGCYLPVDCHGDVRAQPLLIEQPFASAGPRAIEIVDDLANRRALHFHARFTAGQRLQQRRDIDDGQRSVPLAPDGFHDGWGIHG